MTFTTRPELRGTFGAVASTHWLATQAGMAAMMSLCSSSSWSEATNMAADSP